MYPAAFTTEYPVRGIFFFLEEQVQFIQFSPPGGTGLQSVDPGGVHAGVAQNVRQTGQIPLRLVVCPGEEVSEVMGKDLPAATLASRHSAFISRHRLDRSRGWPPLVTSTGPETTP